MTRRHSRYRLQTRLGIAFAMLAVLSAAAVVDAQFRRGRFNVRIATPEDHDGAFHFCRAWFRSARGGDGGDWSVDFPRADINLSIRLAELTKTPVSQTSDMQPHHLIVRVTDDTLFQCPFVMMTEVGSLFFDEQEAVRLREYLLKGGFLWVDDFWGSYAWENWIAEISRVLPPNQYPVRDLPPDHPFWRAMFQIERLPQIPSINHWRTNGGETSERGFDSVDPHIRGISDARGRLMVLMTHNTDISDAWEREGEDPRFFYLFSPNGYAVGINVMMYTMTH